MVVPRGDIEYKTREMYFSGKSQRGRPKHNFMQFFFLKIWQNRTFAPLVPWRVGALSYGESSIRPCTYQVVGNKSPSCRHRSDRQNFIVIAEEAEGKRSQQCRRIQVGDAFYNCLSPCKREIKSNQWRIGEGVQRTRFPPSQPILFSFLCSFRQKLCKIKGKYHNLSEVSAPWEILDPQLQMTRGLTVK